MGGGGGGGGWSDTDVHDVRHVRAVMHAGVANWRFPLKSKWRGNVPGIPGAYATHSFTYLARYPWFALHCSLFYCHGLTYIMTFKLGCEFLKSIKTT